MGNAEFERILVGIGCVALAASGGGIAMGAYYTGSALATGAIGAATGAAIGAAMGAAIGDGGAAIGGGAANGGNNRGSQQYVT